MKEVKNNEITIYDDYAKMKIVSETHGEFEVIIDLDDVDVLSESKWCVNKYKTKSSNYYAIYAIGRKGIMMHRFITNAPKGFVVDHINHNTLDNRKSNLRVCTHLENRKNNKEYENNTSGHVGVCWYYYRGVNKWKSHIKVDSTLIHLGYYDTYEDACKARKEAEEKYFGEFNYSNIE